MSGMIDYAAFAVLVGVLAARPLIPEGFERVATAFVDAGSVGGPTPATSMWLDLILLAVSAVVVWRHRLAARHTLFAGASLTVLALAVGLSTWGASDRRLALNAGAEIFTFAVTGAALFRLVAGRRDFALILAAAAVASAGVNALKCTTQTEYEFNDTLEAWQARKAQLVEQGRDVDDPALVNFERRLKSADSFGYLSHPNVAASVLAAGAVLLIGVAAASLRRGATSRGVGTVCAIALAAAMAYALATTGSMGGGVAMLVGAAIAVVLALFRAWITKRPAFAAGAFIGLQAVAMAGLIGYGAVRSTLPGASLAFRWEYWSAAGHALADEPLTGIGRENFAPFHMRYKSAAATEEVRNPHNLWISLLVELGPLGLTAGIMLLAGAAVAVFRRLALIRIDSAQSPADCADAPITGYAFAALCGIVVLLVQVTFAAVPLAAGGIAVVWLVEVAGLWLVLYFGAIRLFAEAPSALAIGGIAACAALLTHNLVDFSLITAAGLSMLVLAFAASAAGGAAASECAARERRPRGRLGAAFLALATLAHGCLIAIPTQKTADFAANIDAIFAAPLTPMNLHEAYADGMAAARADLFECDLPREAAGRFSALLDQPRAATADAYELAGNAQSLASIALSRNPRSPADAALLAEILGQRAGLAGQLGKSDDAQRLRLQSARQWDAAVQMYPTNPRWRIEAAAARLELLPYGNQSRRQIAAAVLQNLDEAVRIDATRSAENASKLRPAEFERIRRLRAMADAVEP